MTVADLVVHFESTYADRPRIYRAPGRVNLIGEHTDYNDGFVMPAAIGFSAYAAISPRSDRKLLIRSAEYPGTFEFDLDCLPAQRTGDWCDYVVGVAQMLQQKGILLAGSNLLIHGDVPVGAGLSSSAAIEVASALALLSLGHGRLALPEIAKVCRQAENTFVGARVGIMDQFVSCMGKAHHALLLDCRSLDFQLAPIPGGLRLVVCNTMVKHDLATGTYNIRRAECEEGVRFFAKRNPAVHALRDVTSDLLRQYSRELPSTLLKRCTHVVEENQRTQEAARAFADGNLVRMGELMRDSHNSLRDLYEVSCLELDVMVDSAHGLPGFLGGRMTGGGFGGCTVNLVEELHCEEFAARISERFQAETGIRPQIYICSAEDGAQELLKPF